MASENCVAVLRRAGLLDSFDVRVTGIEAAQLGLAGKPAPDTFLKAAELLGVQPARTIVFEDAISGVQAARAGQFGLVVGVDRRGEPAALADHGADIVLSDLTELVGVPAVEPEPDAAVHGRLSDRSFEAVVVHLPPAMADLTPLDSLLNRLGEAGIDVLVVGTGPPTAPLHEVADPVGRLVVCSRDRGPEAVQRLFHRLEHRGVGPGLVLVVGWLAGLALPPGTRRATMVSLWSLEPADDLPPGAYQLGGGALGLVALLEEQLERRRAGRTPSVDEDPAWTIALTGDRPALRRVHQTLLTVADTAFGTRGVREEEVPGPAPAVLAAGVFDEAAAPPTLLEGPLWTSLRVHQPLDTGLDRRTLDLRTGVLYREQPADPVPLRTVRFSSLARPGTMAMRAEGALDWMDAGPGLTASTGDGTFTRTQRGAWAAAHTTNELGGAISAAASQRERTGAGRRTVERIACHAGEPAGQVLTDEVSRRLVEVEKVGFGALLAEQRAAWAARWRDAQVSIVGDPELELAVRLNLFHLMASVATSGEAAVGPRGVTGPAYGGHVFWDADVFVLPFLAASCPPAARAMLEYRIRRLPAARRAAADRGLRGARFPWESARDGFDVTPGVARSAAGDLVPIRTGEHEEHISADVAWAALQYAAWTGDTAFLAGEGLPLVLDTARYWASRVRLDRSGAHLYGVIGPDEYHEPVDDNAFTNVMARWNLRHAVELVESTGSGASAEEVSGWRSIADALVDGYDPDTGRYEQFAGYYRHEPIVISQLAETPVAADLLLGRDRVRGSQIIKQPDVLMLYHLVPEEMVTAALASNIAFYEPRCAHGSSLSPAVHAAVLARAGHADQALRLFRMSCLLDLEDLTGTAAGGLHIATAGGVWQALVFGFCGVRASPGSLVIDPRLPSGWEELTVRLRFQGSRVEVRAGHEELRVRPDGPVPVQVPGCGVQQVTTAGGRWRRAGETWEVAQ